MQVKDGVLLYPEELKEPFLKTCDLVLRDGTRVSPDEIWQFMTDEGPRKYPYYFSADPKSQYICPEDVSFVSGIKLHYLRFSRRWRVEYYRKAGMPLVFIQGGQLLDPYFAAGAVPAQPAHVLWLGGDLLAESKSLKERLFLEKAIEDEGFAAISADSCQQVQQHLMIRKGLVPMDMLAPELCRRCSDMAYLVETHRDSERKIPSFLVDYPENQSADKPWVVEYVAQSVHRLVSMLDDMTGRKTSDEDFRAQIRLSNKLRKLARGCSELLVSWGELNAISCLYLYEATSLGAYSMDPGAALQVLEEFYQELKERVDNSANYIKTFDSPVKLFKAGGSCWSMGARQLHRMGAVEVGSDQQLNRIAVDIAEVGDPYENYAKAILSLPLEKPTQERALWTAEQAREAKADGVVFGGQWGCNYTTAIMRLCSDVIQKDGIPVLMLELNDLGRNESTEGTITRIEAFVEMLREVRK